MWDIYFLIFIKSNTLLPFVWVQKKKKNSCDHRDFLKRTSWSIWSYNICSSKVNFISLIRQTQKISPIYFHEPYIQLAFLQQIRIRFFSFPMLLDKISVPIVPYPLFSVSITAKLATEPENWGKVWALNFLNGDVIIKKIMKRSWRRVTKCCRE